jgi:hypothetical protein
LKSFEGKTDSPPASLKSAKIAKAKEPQKRSVATDADRWTQMGGKFICVYLIFHLWRYFFCFDFPRPFVRAWESRATVQETSRV